MIHGITRFCVEHKKLLLYTILNYIDKFIIFSLPLIVLYITKNVQIYNDVEYIFSIANITIVVLEIGKLYLFYGYKLAVDRDLFVRQAKNYFLFIQLIYSLIGLCIYPFVYHIESPLGGLYIFIFIRILYILFINFFNYYFRLAETPSKIFLYSIPVNITSVVLICLFFKLNLGLTLEMFFLPQCLISVGSILLFFFRFRWTCISGIVPYLKNGVRYAWPIILNTLLISFVNNYGKIYAYNFLSENEMYNFSYLLRIVMIIQMAHASVIAYYSKEIYTNTGLDFRILKLYSWFIGIAIILATLFLIGFNLVFAVNKVRLDIVFVLILFYAVCWCYQSFFELYYNKTNHNKYVLLFSLIGTGVYILLVFGVGVKGVKTLSCYMLISVLINFMLVFGNFVKHIKRYS